MFLSRLVIALGHSRGERYFTISTRARQLDKRPVAAAPYAKKAVRAIWAAFFGRETDRCHFN